MSGAGGHAYIGRLKCCGRIAAAVADWCDTEAHRKSTATDVAEMVAAGYVVERVEDSFVRASAGQWGCTCAQSGSLIF